MSAGPDIRPPAAIDAAWIGEVLALGGIEAEVDRVEAKPIGTGQIGDSVRFSLGYRHAPPGAPASLVGKFPAAGPESRATGVRLGNYYREVRFYQALAPSARISTPRCWFTDVDEATHDFVLIMDDLAPAQPGDQLKGVTLDEARTVLVEAAKLHASHWNDPWLDTLAWVSGSAAAPASAASNEAVTMLWGAFKARYGACLEPRWSAVGDRLTANFAQVATPRVGARCLTHNDFRPDNMMFATPAGGAPVTVLDWQSFAYGVGATDVAYFLAGALPQEVRRAHEAELLALYHRALMAEGVRGYGAAELAADYARGGYLLFLTAFFAAMIVTQTPRGDDMFIQMLSSAAEHMLEHGALELSGT
jgi:hypothetical protein